MSNLVTVSGEILYFRVRSTKARMAAPKAAVRPTAVPIFLAFLLFQQFYNWLQPLFG